MSAHPRALFIVTVLTGNSWLTKRGHKMNVTYVLQGETSLLVSIATTTVSQVARLAVCAVMFDVRPTCFKSFVVDTCTPQTLLSQSPVTTGVD